MRTFPLATQRVTNGCRSTKSSWLGVAAMAGVGACGDPSKAQYPELELAAPPASPTPVHSGPPSPVAPANATRSVNVGPATAPRTPNKPLGNTVAETRTTEVIAQVVLANRQSVRDCYEVELKRDPSLRGRLTVSFTIDPQGRVNEAYINPERSTLTRPALVACASAAVKAMRFPPSSRGFESAVNYPFEFRP